LSRGQFLIPTQHWKNETRGKEDKKGKAIVIDDFHLSVFGSSFIYFVTIKQEPTKNQSDMYITLKLQKNLAMTNDKGG
jgi:hypothetical protein